MSSKYIEIENRDITCIFSDEESILEILNKNKVTIDQSCGGMGSCGTCRILVTSSINLPERNEIEQERSDALGFSDQERLSCQLHPIEKLKFIIPN